MVERILLTGAAGNIGRMMIERLRKPGRVLRLLDIESLDLPESDDVEVVIGSVTSQTVMEAACQDVRAVIHLGGHSLENSWQEIMETNINGTYTVFEAARRKQVERVVFASSNHAVGYQPKAAEPATDYLYPRPDTFYGVGKVAGEAIGSLYHDRYGLEVICIRIGSCFAEPQDARMLGTWLSPDDCARLLDACLSAPNVGFQIIWGVSANRRRAFSIKAAAELGYNAKDDSEKFAEDIIGRLGESAADSPERNFIGGKWCTPEFDTARLEAEQNHAAPPS